MKFGILEIGIGLLVLYALSKHHAVAAKAASTTAANQPSTLGYVPNSAIGGGSSLDIGSYLSTLDAGNGTPDNFGDSYLL